MCLRCARNVAVLVVAVALMTGCQAQYPADTGEPARLISDPAGGFHYRGDPAVIESKRELDHFTKGPGWAVEYGLNMLTEEAEVDWRSEAVVLVPYPLASPGMSHAVSMELDGAKLVVEVERTRPLLDAAAVVDVAWVLAVSKSRVEEVEIHRREAGEDYPLPVAVLELGD